VYVARKILVQPARGRVSVRVLNEMSHVDQYGFRHQFGTDEDLALHYLCQQLHLHYAARRADHQTGVSRWQRLLSDTGVSPHLPLTNTVASTTFDNLHR